MSFILDALKKSDAKRRAQLGPDLTAPATPSVARSSKVARPIRVWGLVGLVGLVLIGAAVVWLVSERGLRQSEALDTQQAVLAQPDAIDEDSGERQSTQPARVSEANDEAASVATSETPAASAPIEPAVEETVSLTDTSTVNQPESPSSLPAPDPTAVEAIEARLVAVTEPESELKAVDAVDQSTEPADMNSRAEAELPQETWQPQAADYLYQWELPLTVRQSLPALNLLVHVYSNLPEDRFVLINGTRFREGDELSPGVTLAEIRPEGALIDFRDYRFLLSQ